MSENWSFEKSEAEALEFFEVSTVEELHRLLDYLINSQVIFLWWVQSNGDYYIIPEPFNPMLEPGWQG